MAGTAARGQEEAAGNSQYSDVLIVGGGIAGLTAAITAAKAGNSVTLLEGAKALGGRAQTTEQDGYYFNLGPHALYKKGHGGRVLKALEVELAGADPVGVPGQKLVVGNKQHLMPASLSSVWKSPYYSLLDRLEVMNLFRGFAKINASQFDHMTWQQTLDTLVKRPRVKAYLHVLCRLTTYSFAPDLVSGGAVIRQIQMASGGVLYLDQGWQSLVTALKDKAEACSVRIHTKTRAREIKRSDRLGAETMSIYVQGGKTFSARSVILALSPAQVAGLKGACVLGLAEYEDKAVPVRLACLDIALGDRSPKETSFALGVDEPLYLSVHSATADLAPEGGALVHTAQYLHPDESQPASVLKEKLEAFTELNLPGWRARVVKSYLRPNMLVSNWLPLASQGGTTGRPTCKVSDGLYIAGDWVGDQGLLADAALASGETAGIEASTFVKTQHTEMPVAAE